MAVGTKDWIPLVTSKYDEFLDELLRAANSDFDLHARRDDTTGEIVLVMDDIAKALYPTVQKFVADQLRTERGTKIAPPTGRKVKLRDRLEAAYKAGWKDCLGAGLGDNPTDVVSAFRLWTNKQREAAQREET